MSSKEDSINQETFTGIITSIWIWIPCENCENTTRHVITNRNDCEEKTIYRCCTCSEDFVITREFYELIYGKK